MRLLIWSAAYQILTTLFLHSEPHRPGFFSRFLCRIHDIWFELRLTASSANQLLQKNSTNVKFIKSYKESGIVKGSWSFATLFPMLSVMAEFQGFFLLIINLVDSCIIWKGFRKHFKSFLKSFFKIIIFLIHFLVVIAV